MTQLGLCYDLLLALKRVSYQLEFNILSTVLGHLRVIRFLSKANAHFQTILIFMCKPFEENSDRALDSQHEENVHLFPLVTPHCRRMKQCFWCPNKVCLKGYIAVQNFVGTAHSIPTSPVNKTRVCIEQHWPILVPCLNKDLTDLSSQQPTLSAFRDKSGSSYGLLVFFIWSEASSCKLRITGVFHLIRSI